MEGTIEHVRVEPDFRQLRDSAPQRAQEILNGGLLESATQEALLTALQKIQDGGSNADRYAAEIIAKRLNALQQAEAAH